MNLFYAMMVDIRLKPCLIVGGGAVAERKMQPLLEAGAQVTIVSPTVTLFIEERAKSKDVIWVSRPYRPEDGEGCFLIVAATSSKEVNVNVYKDATTRGQWINVVDDSSLCNFTVPSVVKRGNLQISISTNGSSPSLAKRIKADLEKVYDEDYAFYLSLMEGIRLIVKRDISDRKRRQTILRELSSSHWIESFRQNPLRTLRRLKMWIESQKTREMANDSFPTQVL